MKPNTVFLLTLFSHAGVIFVLICRGQPVNRFSLYSYIYINFQTLVMSSNISVPMCRMAANPCNFKSYHQKVVLSTLRYKHSTRMH